MLSIEKSMTVVKGECIDCKEAKVRAEENQYAKKFSQGTDCNVLYFEVDKCMKANAGQISPCQEQWSKFRECHDNKR